MSNNPKPRKKSSKSLTGSPRKLDSMATGDKLPESNREIIAAKFGIAPDAFLKYREEPGGIIVAILPNGQKFKFRSDNLTLEDLGMRQHRQAIS